MRSAWVRVGVRTAAASESARAESTMLRSLEADPEASEGELAHGAKFARLGKRKQFVAKIMPCFPCGGPRRLRHDTRGPSA